MPLCHCVQNDLCLKHQLFTSEFAQRLLASLYNIIMFCFLTSTWPHLRCDVGLEEGEDKYKLSLCYSIVYCYNGAQRYEQFLQVG